MTTKMMTPQTETTTADKIETALTSRYRDDLIASLPTHLSAEGYAKAVCGLLAAKPEILTCTKESLLTSIMAAARSGLDPAAGGFYFVQMGNACQLMLSYKGMIQIARDSGAVLDCYARVVREGDTFGWSQGGAEEISHVPDIDENRALQPITHVYAVAVLSSGLTIFECWSRSKIDAHVSKTVKGATNKNSPWVKDFEAMAKKTVIKQFFHSGRLPLTTRAVETDAATTSEETTSDDLVDAATV